MGRHLRDGGDVCTDARIRLNHRHRSVRMPCQDGAVAVRGRGRRVAGPHRGDASTYGRPQAHTSHEDRSEDAWNGPSGTCHRNVTSRRYLANVNLIAITPTKPSASIPWIRHVANVMEAGA